MLTTPEAVTDEIPERIHLVMIAVVSGMYLAAVDGTIVNAWYHAGTFVNASLDKASSGNERNALHIRTQAGQDVTCVQVAGLVARRILCYVKPGDALTRGQRFGFIRFGSRVDVYLAPDARPRVAIGDKVYATETLLAEFPAS